MKNKSAIIVDTLIEKLKKNNHFFGNLAVVKIHGSCGSRAEIATQSGGEMQIYSVIVIKHAN